MAKVKIKDVVKISDIGNVRDENQDRIAVFSNSTQTLALLCDGMGGHKGGSYASQTVVDVMKQAFTKFKGNKPDDWFASTLEKTIDRMKVIPDKEGDKALIDMGTTVVAILIKDKLVRVYNVGDSRAYYFNGSLFQVTIDQNLQNYLIREQNIPEDQAVMVYGGAALTSSLGPRKKADLEIFEFTLDQHSKYLLLTSDGVHDHIAENEAEEILNNDILPLKDKAKKMIEKAKNHGSSDNLSVILVQVEVE